MKQKSKKTTSHGAMQMDLNVLLAAIVLAIILTAMACSPGRQMGCPATGGMTGYHSR